MRVLIVTVLVIGVMVGLRGHVDAQIPAGSFTAYGPTKQSCGTWTSASGADREILRWWMLGFITGAGWQRSVPLTDTDPKGIEAWTDQYCKEHPLVPIAKAAIDLATELGASPANRR